MAYVKSYFKYKNPETTKDIIFFENLINWSQPIVLCEGVFDAIAIKRNAIPILGRGLSHSLLKKILSSDLEDIYIALDKDAFKKALEYTEQFLNMGFDAYSNDIIDCSGNYPERHLKMDIFEAIELIQPDVLIAFTLKS